MARPTLDREKILAALKDGVAFSTAALAGAASSGLAGMHERAVLLGGQLAVESVSGAGTSMMAELPLGDRVEKAK